ncbi:MAG TPA: CPBP family intramembrane glutamic endopeptidase [Planktothrix sp.]
MPKLHRWTFSCLLLAIVYSIQCATAAGVCIDTLPKWFATILQLWFIWSLGRNPRAVAIRTYSCLLPVVLLLSIYGDYCVHPRDYQFPWLHFFLTWLLLQLPVHLWKQPPSLKTTSLSGAPFFYLLALFFVYSWRIPSERLPQCFLHQDLSPGYLWLCLILPQFICCTAATRRAFRMLLTRTNWLRIMAGIALGMVLLALWSFGAGALFHMAGMNASISVLGSTVQADAYNNLLIALYYHVMIITGSYLYVALGEEFCFRLLLPAYLRAKLKAAGREHFWAPFICSAFAFGIMHWAQGDPMWTKILFSFVSGLIYASVQRFSRNMQASVIVHAISNDLPRLIWW